ncbi:MAG: hypothetical protein JW797_05580 [Bradymonadales bacterium]|nr:hypothetical protein [Bradymonadales bacterium]
MPLDWVRRILERQGALVEPQDSGALLALVPDALREAYQLEEEICLSDDRSVEGAISCSYGSELLRSLIRLTLQRGGVTAVEVQVVPGRIGIPQVYEGLNVALRFAPGDPETIWSVIGHFLVDATAIDRREARISAAVCLESGVPIPAANLAGFPLVELSERPPVESLAAIETTLVQEAIRRAAAELVAYRTAVARRLRRDVIRTDRYFQEMDEDLQRRMRRQSSSTGLSSKRALLPGERDRRIQTLVTNHAIQATVMPFALLLLRYPVCTARLTVLRKKQRRELIVRYDPLLRLWHPLLCEGCGVGTYPFAACDDRVHILCPDCARQSRPSPPCCRPPSPKRGGPASVRFEPATATVAVPPYPSDSPLLQKAIAEPLTAGLDHIPYPVGAVYQQTSPHLSGSPEGGEGRDDLLGEPIGAGIGTEPDGSRESKTVARPPSAKKPVPRRADERREAIGPEGAPLIKERQTGSRSTRNPVDLDLCRRILSLLSQDVLPLLATELAEVFQVELPALKKALLHLQATGEVVKSGVGRGTRYHRTPTAAR